MKKSLFMCLFVVLSVLSAGNLLADNNNLYTDDGIPEGADLWTWSDGSSAVFTTTEDASCPEGVSYKNTNHSAWAGWGIFYESSVDLTDFSAGNPIFWISSLSDLNINPGNQNLAPYTRFLNYFEYVLKDQARPVPQEVLTQDAMQFYMVLGELYKKIMDESAIDVRKVVREFINRNIYFVTDIVGEVEIEGYTFKYLEVNIYEENKYILFYPEDCPKDVLRRIGVVTPKAQRFSSMVKGIWIVNKEQIFGKEELLDAIHEEKLYRFSLYLKEEDKARLNKISGLEDIERSLENVAVIDDGSDKVSFGVSYIGETVAFSRLFLEFLLGNNCHSLIWQAIADKEGARAEISNELHKLRVKMSMEALVTTRIKNHFIKDGVISVEQHDQIVGRARALNYLMRKRNYFSSDLKDKVLENPELYSVIFGLRPACIVSLNEINLTEDDISDLEYALWCMKHMLGESIRILRLSNGRVYVYDENKLRAKVAKSEMMIGTTQKGLVELLITRDVSRKRGVFYELAISAIKEAEREVMRLIADAILNNDLDIRRIRKIEIKHVFLCTYERPSALDRTLELQTENWELFGHEQDVVFHVVDNTPGNKVESKRNREIVEKYRERGVKIEYKNREESLGLNEGYADYLYMKYSTQLQEGILDPRIKSIIIDQSGQISREKIKRVVDFSFNTQNIAGARNVTIAWGQDGRMASIDDDSLPLVLTINRRILYEIMGERDEKVRVIKEQMYDELNSLGLGVSIKGGSDFEDFLAKADLSNPKVAEVLKKYYAYSPSGGTGLIPQASGQIVQRDIEHRLRFDRLLHEGLDEYLVTSEDAAIVNIDDEDIFNPAITDMLPVDFLWVFDSTIGQKEGGELGRVFANDLRGIAGSPDPNFKKESARTIMWASGHFNNARDNSAEALVDEALMKWRRTGEVDISDLQQVVRMTVHLSNDHSTSKGFRAGNQACCNMFAMDCGVYPVPTTGSWLRIEEPLQFLLIEFLTNQVMAWSKAAGGHKRIPGERRPNVPKQFLYEEMAMILYPILVDLMLDLWTEILSEPPNVRIRRLGEEYIKRAEGFKINADSQAILAKTRERVAEKITCLLEEMDKEDNLEIRAQLELISKELADQFDLNVYRFTVDESGKVLFWTKQVVSTEGVNLTWIESGTDMVKLSEFDLTKKILLSDGAIIDLSNRTLKPDSSFSIGVVCKETEGRFTEKVAEILKRQLVDDGSTLLLWPDLLEAVKGVGRTAIPNNIDEVIGKNEPSQVTVNGRQKFIISDPSSSGNSLFCSSDSRSHILTRRDIEEFLAFQRTSCAAGVFNSLDRRDGINRYIQLLYEDPFISNLSSEIASDRFTVVSKVKETVIGTLEHSVSNFVFKEGSIDEQAETVGNFVKLLQEKGISHIVAFLPGQRGVVVFLLNEDIKSITLKDLNNDVSLPINKARGIMDRFLVERSYDLSKVRVVILCGGSGERLWPASTEDNPKQFCVFTKDGKTMLRRTIERVTAIVPIEQVYILTVEGMVDAIINQEPFFPIENIIAQPQPINSLTGRPDHRDTGPAIGFMATILEKRYGPDTTMVVMPADHEIPDKNLFYDAILEAIRAAQVGGELINVKDTRCRQNLVTVGIDPHGVPHTGYGYILPADEDPFLGSSTYTVSRFVEKPDPQKARRFVKEGYLWNGGIFAWDVGTILAAISEYAPVVYDGLQAIRGSLGTPQESVIIRTAFDNFPKISMDFAVMDNAGYPFAVKTIEGHFDWSDIGNWNALPVSVDESGNKIAGGEVVVNNVANSIIYNGSGAQVNVQRVSNLIIINFGDSTLVMSKSASADLRRVVSILKADPNLRKYLRSRVEQPEKIQPNAKFSERNANLVRGTTLVLDSAQNKIDSAYGLVVAFGVSGLEITKTEDGLIVRRFDPDRAREKGFSKRYRHREEGGINKRTKRMILEGKAMIIDKKALKPREGDIDIPDEDNPKIIEKIERAKEFLRSVAATENSNYEERVKGLERRAIVILDGPYLLTAEIDSETREVIWQAAHNEPEIRPETKTPGRNVIYLTNKEILELSVAQLAVLLNNEEVEMENPGDIPTDIIRADDNHIMSKAGAGEEYLDSVLHRFALVDVLKGLSNKGHDEIARQYRVNTREDYADLERNAEEVLKRQEKPLGLVLMSDLFLKEIPPWKILESIARTRRGKVWVGVRNFDEKELLERLNYKIVIEGQETPLIENIIIIDENQLAMANRGKVPAKASERDALMTKILIGQMKGELRDTISRIAVVSNPLEIKDDIERSAVRNRFMSISRATQVDIVVPETNIESGMISTNLCILKSLELTSEEMVGQVIILLPIESPQAFYNKLLEEYRAVIELLKNA